MIHSRFKNPLASFACLITLISLSSGAASAHQGKVHGPEGAAPPAKEVAADSAKSVYEQINAGYLSRVKPIFQRSCFDCHGDTTRYPWYYRIPGAKQLIDHDVTESKEHLDLSRDFPFKGHGTPLEDLASIRESIQEGEMPPWRYWILHREAKLSEADRTAVLEWVSESEQRLKSPKR